MITNPSASLRRTAMGFVGRLALTCMVSGTAWLSHLLLALVFAIGALPSSNGPRTERETELSIKGAEDCEASRRNGFDAAAPRRLRPRTDGAQVWELEPPNTPLLGPRNTEVPQPSWQRPRRSIPDDDDDEALA